VEEVHSMTTMKRWLMPLTTLAMLLLGAAAHWKP